MELAATRLANHTKLSKRVQFAIRDLLDLRKDGWTLKGSKASLERQALTLTREELHRKTEEDRRALEAAAQNSSQAARLANIPMGKNVVSGGRGRGPATFGPKSQAKPGPSTSSGKPGSSAAPADGWTTVTNGVRPEKARVPEAAPEPVLLSPEALKKRLHGLLDEYATLQSTKEVDDCITEIRGNANWSYVLVHDALKSTVASTSATWRESTGSALRHLVKTNQLAKEESLKAFGDFMASTYPDLFVDVPKIPDYTAQVSYIAACSAHVLKAVDDIDLLFF
jgi:hypothetical protein